MKVSYVAEGTPFKGRKQTSDRFCTGTPMQEKDLDWILDYCKNTLTPGGQKHKDGVIFPVLKSTLGEADTPHYGELRYDGTICVDIDHISTGWADKIFNSFEKICKYLTCLYAIQYSSSYYIRKGSGDVGLHIYLGDKGGDGFTYADHSKFLLATVAVAIYKATGLNVYDLHKTLWEKTKGSNERIKVLDTHNCKLGQRFFLYHSDYRKNPYFVPMEDSFYEREIERARKSCPLILGYKNNSKNSAIASNEEDVKLVGKITKKIDLSYGPDFTVANYLNHIGWEEEKIVRLMLAIDNHDEVAYLKKHGKSREDHFRQITRAGKDRKLTEDQVKRAKDILRSVGIDVVLDIDKVEATEKKEQTEANTMTVDIGDDYLSSYVDLINDKINQENVLAIVAPTGSGKTTMIMELIKRRPRSIIVNPTNINNHLYEGTNIVGSENGNSLKPRHPNTLIIDQFVKRRDEILKLGIELVIIDESHEPTLSQSYRDASVKFMKDLPLFISRGIKIVFVSATPAYEILRNNAFILNFKRNEHRNIKFKVCVVGDTFENMRRDLIKEEYNYDSINIFSNRDAKLLYAYSYINRLDSCIYHSDWRDNLNELRRTEKLTHKINFLTCIAFNGLNIKNEYDKVLIEIRYVKGETTYNEIIQIIGRFRFCKNIDVRIYVDGKFENDVDLEEVFKDAKLIIDSDSSEIINSYWERMSNNEIQDALLELTDFKNQFTLKNIISFLKMSYEVKGFKEIKKTKGSERRNVIKKKASDLFRECRRNGVRCKSDDVEVSKYTDRWGREIDNLVGSYGEEIVDIFNELFSKKSTLLVDSVIEKVKRVLWVVSFTDEMWKEERMKVESLSAKDIGVKTRQSINNIIKKDDAIREKYKNLSLCQVGETICSEIDSSIEALFEGNSRGGSKGGLKGRRVEYEGKQYETIRELAEAVGKGEKTIYSWLKKGKARYL